MKTLSVDGNFKGKADAIWLDRQVTSSILDNGKQCTNMKNLLFMQRMIYQRSYGSAVYCAAEIFHRRIICISNITIKMFYVCYYSDYSDYSDHAGATTAQVTPLELTNKMMDAAIEKGSKLIYGAVEGVDIIEGKITGVRVKGKLVCT